MLSSRGAVFSTNLQVIILVFQICTLHTAVVLLMSDFFNVCYVVTATCTERL